ncbi:hypothetical protein TVAG_250540 [Trichomonas vaginalis G3]|uniref:Uncharacterized protein n=1 Tax=Trichomonas vaginalis (strain ATCC PRA-98 / G3) TaxID=412133 RepID=A2ESQ3_TRIV3|nr:hypothetical protein TVAGG3_0826230 [Trichomonas vaginalis G3]EAY04294.1 hypothetical protein TVAG_250540 [Trichomonas vaginalis G3]KAI5498255.1 hypothetical protein TVAGG3_0826230 [Trichomonas vaginalis G3]|eukprot:XP_001316517.1 hypothetical protein [Trichomonas vaginalis G3]
MTDITEQVYDYVKEIIDVVEDEHILADLSAIQAKFEQIVKSGDIQGQKSSFLLSWDRLVNTFSSKRLPNILAFRDLFKLLSQIRKTARPFSNEEYYPSKLTSIYVKSVEKFKNYLGTFKDAINNNTLLTDKQYVALANSFYEDVSDSIARTFMLSSVPNKNELIEKIQKTTETFVNVFQNSPQYLQTPQAVDNLTILFNDYFKPKSKHSTPKSSGSSKSKRILIPEDTDTMTRQILSIEQLRSDLSECSRRIAEHASVSRGDLAHKLIDESQYLSILANAEIIVNDDSQKAEMDRQIQAYKELAQMINRADAIPLDVDMDKLESMNKLQLISLIESLLRKEKVPLELKVSKGAPDDYKELARRYDEARKYNEEIEATVQKLNLQIVQLKGENKRLKIEYDSANNVKVLKDRIKEIDQRRSEIADELRRNMITGQTMTIHGTRPTADLYRDEITALKEERDEILEQLQENAEDGANLKIKLLEKENKQLQQQLQEKIERIQKLESQVQSNKRYYS